MQDLISPLGTAHRRRFVPRHHVGNPLVLRENELELRLAASPADTIEAQRLRFDVFLQELRLGDLVASRPIGLDQDAHDIHCDHLLVIDTERDRLVGTYRLLPFDRVPSFGFPFRNRVRPREPEAVGAPAPGARPSCVALEYRNGSVIRLLFRGIMEYLRRCKANALMGCASVYGVGRGGPLRDRADADAGFPGGTGTAGPAAAGIRRAPVSGRGRATT